MRTLGVGAGGVEAGLPAGVLAVPLSALRFPGRGVPDGTGLDSALVVGGAGGLVDGELAVFCRPVVVARVRVRRDGRVQARGHVAEHARLGLVEQVLPAGLVERLVEKFGVREKRLRALSAATAVRCVLAMTLLPGADLREVVATVAGELADVPWEKPWRVPGGEVLGRHRERLGAELFAEAFTEVAALVAAEPEHTAAPPGGGAGWLGGLLLCAVDGTQVRCPDTPANREEFGSSGTADDSAPFPQVRAVLVSVCATRAVLGAALDGSHTGEQTLTRRVLSGQPGVFGAGRLFLFDRNFLGVDLVREVLASGAHVLMRVKSDVRLPNLGWLPDGSYTSRLGGEGGIPVRVVDYDVAPPDGAATSGELFCLVTDLLDHTAYPAAGLAAAYPQRWGGSETTIKENKSTVTGAGPSTGPVLRSTTPATVRQEVWAWLTAGNLVRAVARRAARTGRPAAPGRPARQVSAREVSFTAALRETVRSIGSGLRAAARSAAAVLSRPLQVDRHRHRPRVTKSRQKFPSATSATTVTGPGEARICAPHPAVPHPRPPTDQTATPATSKT